MNTLYLTSDDVQQAASLLRQGKLVALPTETVYGLAADATQKGAVRAVYDAKGRPEQKPLNVLVDGMGMVETVCRDIPGDAYRLAEAFWPGPLTMILQRRENVPNAVTCGLDTVGIRCPGHPLALAVIRTAGIPVAAPSGNLSGRPSPTCARHMLEDMEGKIPAILDGGPCAVGVESTILDLTCRPPRLLRPGGVTLEQLREVLGEVAVDPAVTRQMEAGEKPRAPGMKYRHYAPRAPVTVVSGEGRRTARYIRRNLGDHTGVICFEEYRDQFPGCQVRSIGSAQDRGEQARRVFDALRSFDGTDVTAIFAQCPGDGGLGLAVANRLKKAAGFQVVELGEGTP